MVIIFKMVIMVEMVKMVPVCITTSIAQIDNHESLMYVGVELLGQLKNQ